jgi:hypothetical protein
MLRSDRPGYIAIVGLIALYMIVALLLDLPSTC